MTFLPIEEKNKNNLYFNTNNFFEFPWSITILWTVVMAQDLTRHYWKEKKEEPFSLKICVLMDLSYFINLSICTSVDRCTVFREIKVK